MMRNTPLYELTLCVGVIEAAARFAHAHDRPTAAILFGAAAEHARGVIRQTTGDYPPTNDGIPPPTSAYR
jgi:hypothetical protein